MLILDFSSDSKVEKCVGGGGVEGKGTNTIKYIFICYEIDIPIVNNETSSFVEMQRMDSIV